MHWKILFELVLVHWILLFFDSSHVVSTEIMFSSVAYMHHNNLHKQNSRQQHSAEIPSTSKWLLRVLKSLDTNPSSRKTPHRIQLDAANQSLFGIPNQVAFKLRPEMKAKTVLWGCYYLKQLRKPGRFITLQLDKSTRLKHKAGGDKGWRLRLYPYKSLLACHEWKNLVDADTSHGSTTRRQGNLHTYSCQGNAWEQ